jgi:hypothetical protein
MTENLLRLALAAALLPLLAAADAPVQLNPKAVVYDLPAQIPWHEVSAIPGLKIANLVGDGSKPGALYVQMIHWPPHTMSHPHYHANNRYITVLSGTWWVGTGPKFDPERTVPMPAGSFVTHYAHEIHYDGAKDGEAVIEIVGIGPAAQIPAEQK